MNLDLKPDERVLAYGIAGLVLAFIFGPVGLFVGIRARNLGRAAAAGYKSAEPGEFNPDLVKIGYWLGIAGMVIGGISTALLCLGLLFIFFSFLASVSTMTFFG